MDEISPSSSISDLSAIQVQGGSSNVTQLPDYLAPVRPEVFVRGPEHQKLVNFLTTMDAPASKKSVNKQEIRALISGTLTEVKHAPQAAAPVSKELVGKDIMLLRGTISSMNGTSHRQYKMQKEVTSAAKELLETRKRSWKGIAQKYDQKSESLGGTRRKGPMGLVQMWKHKLERSDAARQGVLQGLYAMIDSLPKWVQPEINGDQSHAFEQVDVAQCHDVNIIVRTAKVLTPEQQSKVYARLVSVSNKLINDAAVMRPAGEWLSKNIQGSNIVLLECVNQLMCGNVRVEKWAYKNIKHHFGQLPAEKDRKELCDQFDAMTIKEWKWAPNKFALLANEDNDRNSHNEFIKKLKDQFQPYFPERYTEPS